LKTITETCSLCVASSIPYPKEEEDEVDGGVGANLVNESGINEDQLCNELCCTPVKINNIYDTPMEHNNQ
jgi:hypothetical protein